LTGIERIAKERHRVDVAPRTKPLTGIKRIAKKRRRVDVAPPQLGGRAAKIIKNKSFSSIRVGMYRQI